MSHCPECHKGVIWYRTHPITWGSYRASDPPTSREAAENNAPRAPRHRDLALRVIREHPAGLTDFELADLTGLAQTSIGKRRGELRDRGLVEDSGERRPSPSGSAAIVWRAVRYDQTITDHHQDKDQI